MYVSVSFLTTEFLDFTGLNSILAYDTPPVGWHTYFRGFAAFIIMLKRWRTVWQICAIPFWSWWLWICCL